MFDGWHSAVVEVANGDYGSFVSHLAIACDSPNNNYEKLPMDGVTTDMRAKTATLEAKTLALANQPLLDTSDTLDDGRFTYRVPSEWSKFWTLVGRCQVHYFRDWVSTVFWGAAKKP